MYRVIIADDDPWAIIDIKSCFPFASYGFGVVAECASAETALPLIVEQLPQLVITDIRMEQKNGLDLIRSCRARSIPSLFVILSGYDSFEYAKEAVKLGAFYYMLKPIRDSEAKDVLQRAASQLASSTTSQPRGTGNIDNDPFQRMIRFLQERSGEACTLEDLSNTFFLNRTYICDLFKKRTGKTFTENLADIRMHKARSLLVNTSLSVNAVAQRVGINDSRYFARVFKTIMGTTPSGYRMDQKTQRSENVF